MAELYNVETPLTHSVLFAGSGQVETIDATVKSGQNLSQYEVVAIETASGEIVTYAEGGSGGAEVARYIAVYAVDATGGATTASFYKAGQFNADVVVWSGTPTDAQKAVAFSDTPISLLTLNK